MSMVQIDDVGGKRLEQISKMLAGIPGGMQKATSAALKRASQTAKTKAGQFAAAEYTINKGDFMRNVTHTAEITADSDGVVSMSIGFAGTVLPLLTFNTKFSRNGLVQTQVKRNGGASTLQHAFVARVFGPAAVFERVGTTRFPVEQKFGPSTGHMMQNEQVIQKMEETIHKTFETRMEHEVMRILNGWGG